MLGRDLSAFSLLSTGRFRQLYRVRSTFRSVGLLVSSISMFNSFDILDKQLSYLDLIIFMCAFKMSLEVIFPWPDLFLLLTRRGCTSVVKLGSLHSQQTMACLLVSCQVMGRSKAIVIVAARYVTLERTSVGQHVLSVGSQQCSMTFRYGANLLSALLLK